MKAFLLTLPIIISLLCCVSLLVFSKKRSLSLKLLGLFFFFFSAVLFAILFQYLQEFYPQIRNVFPYFEIFFYASMLMLPVLIYFYVASLTDYIKTYPTLDKYIPHLWVPILSLLFNIYSFINKDPDALTTSNATDFFNFFSLKIIFVIFNVYYLIRVIMIYKRHRTRLNNVLSYDYGISLKWILLFLLGYVFFVLCFFVLNPDSSPYVVYIPLVLILTYLYSKRHAQITISLEEKSNSTSPYIKEIEVEEAYILTDNSSSKMLDMERRSKLKTHILNVMETQQPYLKKDLSIYDLSKIAETNSSYISFVLNNDFNSNFSSFINAYRVDKAKELLVSSVSTKYTIETIAENAGFHSKSAFNAAFKKRVGMPPSVYRKKNKI